VFDRVVHRDGERQDTAGNPATELGGVRRADLDRICPQDVTPVYGEAPIRIELDIPRHLPKRAADMDVCR
jgi:hypothetical protein